MDFNGTTPYDKLVEKWSPVLDHKDMPDISDGYKRKTTAALLENQEAALREQHGGLHETANSAGSAGSLAFGDSSATSSGGIAAYDPILISLVRRAMPNLIAYDVCGVQPMSAPTGLIFALKSNFVDLSATSQSGTRGTGEALFAEPGNFGGTGGGSHPAGGFTGYTAGSMDPLFGATAGSNGAFPNGNLGQGFGRDVAEGLGDSVDRQFGQMAFSIERTAVTAKTRALKAEYTTELAQDLKAVHGLDAEAELANILSTEILAEINREVIRTIYGVSQLGSQQLDLKFKTGSVGNLGGHGGVYDVMSDSDGRWSAERWRGLMFQIERECNVIAKRTRRGKGNFIITDADTASALAMGGFLNISPALNQNLEVDDTGNTYAGLLNGKIKVYIDPYVQASTGSIFSTNVANHFFCAGYRGSNPYDAGLFYCPYVPLQMVRAVGENTFQPKIGFKTRYGIVSNPFVRSVVDKATGIQSGAPDGETLTVRVNPYYRITRVVNLHGAS
jgi:hypothetical protein